MSDIGDRVARGVALLDERVPGWVDKVDLNKLDVSHGGNCVVGQVFGDYSVGLNQLALHVVHAADHGFQSSPPPFPVSVENFIELIARVTDGLKDYEALTEEWRRVIGILRQNTATPVADTVKESVLV